MGSTVAGTGKAIGGKRIPASVVHRDSLTQALVEVLLKDALMVMQDAALGKNDAIVWAY